MTYSDDVLSLAPLGYWRLEEDSGTTLADSSGNNFTGTYGSGAILGQDGVLVGPDDDAASGNG